MEILFDAGLQHTCTNNCKKIGAIAGLSKPMNHWNCFTPKYLKEGFQFTNGFKPSTIRLQTLNLNHYLCALWQNRSKNLS